MRLSNRAFWGIIIICASGLSSTVIAQSDILRAKQITAEKITISDKDGRPIIIIGTNAENAPYLSMGSYRDGSFAGLMASDKGASLLLRDKKMQTIFTNLGASGPRTVEEKNEVPSVADTESTSKVKELKRFAGSTSRRTEPFTIKAKKWRVRWSLKSTESVALLMADLYRTSDGRSVQMIANTAAPGGDVTYVYEAGEFYLDISTSGAYELIIEEVP